MQGERAKSEPGIGGKREVQGWGPNSHDGLYLCAGHGTAVSSGDREWGKPGCGCRAVGRSGAGWRPGGASALWRDTEQLRGLQG